MKIFELELGARTRTVDQAYVDPMVRRRVQNAYLCASICARMF